MSGAPGEERAGPGFEREEWGEAGAGAASPWQPPAGGRGACPAGRQLYANGSGPGRPAGGGGCGRGRYGTARQTGGQRSPRAELDPCRPGPTLPYPSRRRPPRCRCRERPLLNGPLCGPRAAGHSFMLMPRTKAAGPGRAGGAARADRVPPPPSTPGRAGCFPLPGRHLRGAGHRPAPGCVARTKGLGAAGPRPGARPTTCRRPVRPRVRAARGAARNR